MDRNRPITSAFTMVFWASALYLQTAYTTLLTPINILSQSNISGTELDFSSKKFWKWVRSKSSSELDFGPPAYNYPKLQDHASLTVLIQYNYQDSEGKVNRTMMGCTWYTYIDSQGQLTFHTCPFVGDPVNFLSSGVASAQNLTSRNPTVDFMGKDFSSMS